MADLGYFLQSFNPMDFIKGYEQSEKFATEQDLAKARAQSAQQTAEKESILLGEFKTPQYTETRRATDESKQFESLLSASMGRLNLGVAEEPQFRSDTQTALRETAAGTAVQAKLGRGAAEFDLSTQPDRQKLQRATLATDLERSKETQRLRVMNQDIALGEAAERAYGVEGRQKLREIGDEVAELKSQDPNLSDYEALGRLAQTSTDRAKITLIGSMQKNVAIDEAIRYQNAPQSPEFRNAVSRLAPGITVGDVDPRTGAMPIYRITGRDETGQPIVDRENPVGMVPYTTQDIERFIYTIGGRMPTQQRQPAGRAAAAKPGAPNPLGDASARITGGGAPAGAPAITPAPAATPGAGATPAAAPKPAAAAPKPAGAVAQMGVREVQANTERLLGELKSVNAEVGEGADLKEMMDAANRRYAENQKTMKAIRSRAFGARGGGQTEAPTEIEALRKEAERAAAIARDIGALLKEQQKSIAAEAKLAEGFSPPGSLDTEAIRQKYATAR